MISCILCGQQTSLKSLICPACCLDLPQNNQPCSRCGIPIKALGGSGFDTFCEDCFVDPPFYLSSRIPFLYQFPMDQLISAMKYQAQPQLSKALSKLMAKQIKQQDMAVLPEALIPIPMHPSKQRRRGYNQATYLAKHLGKVFGIPIMHNALEKITSTDAQRNLSAKERQQNLSGAFRIKPSKMKQLSKLEHVAIIDDVVTTGATANEASHCLTKAGIEQIEIWAIARTP